jgi:metacaspase-1
MDYRIVWIHGIGEYHAGYSAAWEHAFDEYLMLPHDDYIEVCWDTVFTGARALPGARARQAPRPLALPLTPKQQVAEAEVRQELTTILQARASALALPPPGVRAAPRGVVEWSELQTPRPGARGWLPDWLAHPDTYLGDFTKYLVSRRIRTAVKEKAKEQLRPLVDDGYSIAVIAHSWGTVVAYDSLRDLETELPALRIANLITLGSPLWLVRHLLDDTSGRKPGEVADWINIHARGDLVGAWLKPAFQDDQDYEVPTRGDDAHGSYFVEGNVEVQRDIVARAILAPPG